MSLTQQYALDLYRLARARQTAEPRDRDVFGDGGAPSRPRQLPSPAGTYGARWPHALWARLRSGARLLRERHGRHEVREGGLREGGRGQGWRRHGGGQRA